MLLHAGVEIELLTEEKQDICFIMEHQVRGRIVQVSKRLARADDEKFIVSIDASDFMDTQYLELFQLVNMYC